jgi:hypothetical protein
LTAARGIPTIYGLREFVDAGGLMSYGPSLADLWRRAATYVDKILKGEACQPSRRAADEVRAGDQPQDRQGARAHHPAIAAATRGSGDRVSQRKPGGPQNPQHDAQLPLALSPKRRSVEPEQAAKLAVARRARPSALSGQREARSHDRHVSRARRTPHRASDSGRARTWRRSWPRFSKPRRRADGLADLAG